MGRKKSGIFWVFPVELSAHTLLLCVLNPWFSINKPLFLQKSFWDIIKEYIHLGLGCKFGLQRNKILAIIRPKSVDFLGIWWCVLHVGLIAPWSVGWFAFSAKYFSVHFKKENRKSYIVKCFFFSTFLMGRNETHNSAKTFMKLEYIFLFRY